MNNPNAPTPQTDLNQQSAEKIEDLGEELSEKGKLNTPSEHEVYLTRWRKVELDKALKSLIASEELIDKLEKESKHSSQKMGRLVAHSRKYTYESRTKLTAYKELMEKVKHYLEKMDYLFKNEDNSDERKLFSNGKRVELALQAIEDFEKKGVTSE